MSPVTARRQQQEILPPDKQLTDAQLEKLASEVNTLYDALEGHGIKVGKKLLTLKKACRHGQFEKLFNDGTIVMAHSTANKLMAIADDPLLSKSSNWRKLPKAWTTRYKLLEYKSDAVAKALDEGKLTPETKASELDAAIGVRNRKRKPAAAGTTNRMQPAPVANVGGARVLSVSQPAEEGRERAPDQHANAGQDARMGPAPAKPGKSKGAPPVVTRTVKPEPTDQIKVFATWLLTLDKQIRKNAVRQIIEQAGFKIVGDDIEQVKAS